jgi:hypothetical protein
MIVSGPNQSIEINQMVEGYFQQYYKENAPSPDEFALIDHENKRTGSRLKHHHGVTTTPLVLLMTGNFTPGAMPFVIADDEECNTMEFPSQSEARFSLLTYLALKHGDDPDAIRDELEESTLFQGITKWNDSEHGSWERLQKTEIPRAIAGAAKFKGPRASSPDHVGIAASTVQTLVVNPTPAQVHVEGFDVDPVSGEKISCFDRSTVKGIYKDVVDLVTAGTTMPPQFPYGVIKTVVGALLAGKVKFAAMDDAFTTRYFLAIGRTGSGKGWSWRRMEPILSPAGYMDTSLLKRLKVVNSADSAAGIRDLFFDEPQDQAMLIFIDEVRSLGNKASGKKQPEILDLMGELANSRSVSRVKARKNKKESGAATMHGADLACIMCAPSADSIATAFTGRMDEGFNDRLIPEFAIPPRAGGKPALDMESCFLLHEKIRDLIQYYKGRTVGITEEATAAIEACWESQPEKVMRKVRFKAELELDAHLNAIGRHADNVELEDVLDAITNFTRRLEIRDAFLVKENKSDVGRYISIFKRLADKMLPEMTEGRDPWEYAMSKRDFLTDSHAYRDDELDIAERAWSSFASNFLQIITKEVQGQVRAKYYPAPRF